MSRLGLKIALSIFTIYHILVVAILPNPTSIVARQWGAWLAPYANPFIFNRTWQFFSPGPTPMFSIEYEVIEDPNSTDERPVHVFPPHREVGSFDDLYVRSFSGMRFLGANDENYRRYFVTYLCRQYPKAVAITARSVVQEVRNIERSQVEWMDFKDIAERFDLPRQTFDCKSPEAP